MFTVHIRYIFIVIGSVACIYVSFSSLFSSLFLFVLFFFLLLSTTFHSFPYTESWVPIHDYWAKDAFDTWPYSIEKKLTCEMWTIRDTQYDVCGERWEMHMDLKCAVCILSLNFRCGFCCFDWIQRFSTFEIYEYVFLVDASGFDFFISLLIASLLQVGYECQRNKFMWMNLWHGTVISLAFSRCDRKNISCALLFFEILQLTTIR